MKRKASFFTPKVRSQKFSPLCMGYVSQVWNLLMQHSCGLSFVSSAPSAAAAAARSIKGGWSPSVCEIASVPLLNLSFTLEVRQQTNAAVEKLWPSAFSSHSCHHHHCLHRLHHHSPASLSFRPRPHPFLLFSHEHTLTSCGSIVT